MDDRNIFMATYILNHLDESTIKTLSESSKDNLGLYHHTLGRVIRNTFDLWKEPWIPEIRDGCDWSPNHPDQRSMTVIELMWDILQTRKHEMKKITYKSGYKYVLQQPYTVKLDIVPEKCAMCGNFVILDTVGNLTINPGYAWDGPSGPTIDTKNFMRGSLIHDALFQLMREGQLDTKYFDQANEELQKACIEDGMSWIRAKYVYLGVQWFGKKFISGQPNPCIEAP